MTTPSVRSVLRLLKAKGSRRNVVGMQRFGIRGHHLYGVSVGDIRAIGKRLPRDHRLAAGLWRSGVHEARILASIIDEPSRVTRAQMESWVKQFDSWDLCDQVCMNLFDQTKFAFSLAVLWSKRKEEFVKRAGFALMAVLAVHGQSAPDLKFLPFFRAILQQLTDPRPFVRKAVNWALRQIGKRNRALNQLATHASELLKNSSDTTVRWVGSDAFRELTSTAVQHRLRRLDNQTQTR